MKYTKAKTLLPLVLLAPCFFASSCDEVETLSHLVVYRVIGQGKVNGKEFQMYSVLAGDDCVPVTAMPSDGYVFSHWDDGYTCPVRHDKCIYSLIEKVAFFVPITQ